MTTDIAFLIFELLLISAVFVTVLWIMGKRWKDCIMDHTDLLMFVMSSNTLIILFNLWWGGNKIGERLDRIESELKKRKE